MPLNSRLPNFTEASSPKLVSGATRLLFTMETLCLQRRWKYKAEG
jgi:hypothetical protein